MLIHGDAAFAGQGVVAECFGLSGLRGHRTGGSMHFIVNNQIGFTTYPRYSRSSPYPSDVAKLVEAPIFHVNGDDPEAVVYCAKIATEFRQKFHKPVVIDMFCYRRFGHNEGDEPGFTQPLMYRTIKSHPTTLQIYAKKLVEEGVIGADRGRQDARRLAPSAGGGVRGRPAITRPTRPIGWTAAGPASSRRATFPTTTAAARPPSTPIASSGWPSASPACPKASTSTRRSSASSTTAGARSTPATASIGRPARRWPSPRCSTRAIPCACPARTVERGTFSQRHSVLIDQESEARYLPFNNIRDGQARYEVINSMLSEEAVLGFEYGYSLAEPNALTVWEAQFGDFANGAQVVFDQFISAGERKWLRMSGLVCMLPHGYEGQGPEHSSARLERYLQMCAEDNMQVRQLHDAGQFLPRACAVRSSARSASR